MITIIIVIIIILRTHGTNAAIRRNESRSKVFSLVYITASDADLMTAGQRA